MRYTLTLSEHLFDQLADAVFSRPGVEGAAYLCCGISSTAEEQRLLARAVIPVRDDHYLVRTRNRLSIASDSYVPIAKRASLNKEGVLFVHSHPEDVPDFSRQDDAEEAKLLAFFGSRAAQMPHGSMVFSSRNEFKVRIQDARGWQPVHRVRLIGNRFRFVDQHIDDEPLPTFFDRQVRAFGPDIQRLLCRLHVGVVGAGGTGSAVIEQLTRLGIGRLSVFDGESLDKSNVTRVYGSTLSDHSRSKAEIQEDHVRRIGFKTVIEKFPRHITDEAAAHHLRDCDVIFGCTDKHAPRGILVRIATRYLIPVFDMAVKIHSEAQTIRGIWGRVTTLLPGTACLFCRGTIDPDTIRAESLPPEQRARELEEGYVPELATNEPAVIMFTTAVAAQAINEFLHRLTGFMGPHRRSTETLMLFHEGRVRTNQSPALADCFCQRTEHWGRGDSKNFLGVTW